MCRMEAIFVIVSVLRIIVHQSRQTRGYLMLQIQCFAVTLVSMEIGHILQECLNVNFITVLMT